MRLVPRVRAKVTRPEFSSRLLVLVQGLASTLIPELALRFMISGRWSREPRVSDTLRRPLLPLQARGTARSELHRHQGRHPHDATNWTQLRPPCRAGGRASVQFHFFPATALRPPSDAAGRTTNRRHGADRRRCHTFNVKADLGPRGFPNLCTDQLAL